MTIDKNTKIYLGQTEIVKIKKGDVVIWEKGQTGPDYLYIENTYDGSNTITFTTTTSGSPSSDKYSNQVEYSTDKVNWTTLTFDTSSPSQITINQGEKLYLRNDSGVFSYWSSSNKYYTKINASQNCILGGNVNTLLDYNNADNLSLNGKYGCFFSLFSNSHITDASGLKLPETTLEDFCYQGMFYGCTSLTTAPALPATTLAQNCYGYMFQYCTSLISAPVLPATTLASSCYRGMFYGCTSLTTAPALPAATLVSNCYQEMFRDCSNLNTIIVYSNTLSGNDSTSNWVRGVASTGTFYQLGTFVFDTGVYYGVPSGWTVETTPPN